MIRIRQNRPKYGAIKTRIDDQLFDSHAEAKYYLSLKRLKEAGIVTRIECHPKFVFQPAYRRCCGVVYIGKDEMRSPVNRICPKCRKVMKAESALYYEADFRVTYADGHVEIVDVKGVRTRAFEIARKTFEYRNPELTVKIEGGRKW